MQILLLSAYDTDSHQSWCLGLMAYLPKLDWCYLNLPGRYFSWRIRGNALSWALGDEAHLLSQPFDLIVATSMVDLATLRGLVPNLANTPAIMYFHENQFAYPKSQQQHASIEPQMVNLYGALSAQRVLFNSAYNLESFMAGADKLLNKLPDQVPSGVVQKIRDKALVLSVPIEPAKKLIKRPPYTAGSEPLMVIWNHRWEYDKGPELLKAVLDDVEAKNLPIHFIIAGLSFRQVPEAFQQLQKTHYRCLKHFGSYIDKQYYFDALANSHVVLSTAHHEFQGLAMLEGAAYGCIPLAPKRLAYPEWVPANCLYDEHKNIYEQSQEVIKRLMLWQSKGLPPKVAVTSFYWENLIAQYLAKFTEATAGP